MNFNKLKFKVRILFLSIVVFICTVFFFYLKNEIDGFPPIIVFMIILSLVGFIYLLLIKNMKDTALLLDSRQLFLRTVMHELKTPIAKGKIVSELIDDERQKSRLSDIFDKLTFLIDDFAKLEQVISKNYEPNLKEHDLHTILRISIDMLMLESINERLSMESIEYKQVLKVDMDLISMALKNLIDNGIKYSDDSRVIIKGEDNMLLFISKGNMLAKPLNEYFKPFHSETKDKNHGMGLGLYIVKAVLDIHGFSLKHEYKNGENIFIVEFFKL